jgi:purine-binding chemotaxis protein CheW
MAQVAKAENQTFLVSTFFLEDTLFGVDTARVQEIIRIIEMTRIHEAQEYILGVINLRGKIVTIINLGTKIGLAPSRAEGESRILIVDWGEEYVGLLVDSVSDVVVVERAEIKPSPSNVKGVQSRFFEGVYDAEGRLVTILNVNEVISSD